MSDQGDDAALRQLDQTWNRAYREKNLELLDEVLADDWVGLTPTHEVITKERLLASQHQAPPPYPAAFHAYLP